MTTYTSVSVFGPNPYPTTSPSRADTRGWGSGWPNAHPELQAKVAAAGIALHVRREIAALTGLLLQITARYYHLKPDACWGYANRAIRGSNQPSNHSWGLAVDLNSDDNPMAVGSFRTTIPPAVVHAWEACGFQWGGRYRHRQDTMHFEFSGRPSDVPRFYAIALRILGGQQNGSITETSMASVGKTIAESGSVKDLEIRAAAIRTATGKKPISGGYWFDCLQLGAIAFDRGAINANTYNYLRSRKNIPGTVAYVVIELKRKLGVPLGKVPGWFDDALAAKIRQFGYTVPMS